MHRFVRGSMQWTHVPHSGAKSVTTWSPGAQRGDALADRLDDAGSLVAEHARGVAGRVGAGGGVEVGVAHAAGVHADEHLAGPGPVELDVLDDERPAELLEDCCADLHGRDATAFRLDTRRLDDSV